MLYKEKHPYGLQLHTYHQKYTPICTCTCMHTHTHTPSVRWGWTTNKQKSCDNRKNKCETEFQQMWEKCRLWVLLKKGLHTAWWSKAIHSFPIRGPEQEKLQKPCCFLLHLFTLNNLPSEDQRVCDGVYTWRRSERHLGAEAVITLKQRQYALYLTHNSTRCQWKC